MKIVYAFSVLSVFMIFSALAAEVGFQTVSVPDPPGAPLTVGIWYPTSAAPSDQRLNLFTQRVATDAPLNGEAHALVVISHGNGGSFDNHYDTALALAQAGFVVAALTHPGDNYRDKSRETDLAARPRAVHVLIDYMLAAWPSHTVIDPAKVGMFGFSSGGFTTLVLIGGVPDLTKIGPYCTSHPQVYVCNVVREHPVATRILVTDWIIEPRIKAAVVVAPALGFVFAPAGLTAVQIPVQLWRAGDDHILPSPDYVEPVRDALPQPPEYHVVAGADHFDFLAPCSEDLTRYVPAICQERGAFDRATFHRTFNAEITRFFKQTLH